MEQNLSLSNVQHWKKFLAESDIFDTEDAVRWFVRRNEIALVEAGAIIKIRNQWFFVRPLFDEVFIGICRGHAREMVQSRAEVAA